MTPPDLLTSALDHLPTAQRENAEQIAYLGAAGFGTMEIGEKLSMTWRAVNTLRTLTANACVQAMRDDGYSTVEVIRTLGVPTAMV